MFEGPHFSYVIMTIFNFNLVKPRELATASYFIWNQMCKTHVKANPNQQI